MSEEHSFNSRKPLQGPQGPPRVSRSARGGLLSWGALLCVVRVSRAICMWILDYSVCRERRPALMKWVHGLQAWFHKTAQEVSLIWSLSSWLCGHLGLQQGLGLG